ncbi:AbrB/MazE/SpoVT family DNA-binding domain-containing protein [Leptothoe sp. ISB3NOV94-8A]
MKAKLRKVGNSISTTFPKEILETFNPKEGDSLTMVVMDDGIKLMDYTPEFEQVMAAYKQGASQYCNDMRELADG